MSSESIKLSILVKKKILVNFKQFEKNFTKKSNPVFMDKTGERIDLKRIYELESDGKKSIAMIAVTRNQYDVNNFLKYENYIQKTLKLSRIYYGLWSNGKKAEYDVLYAIPTDDCKEIQIHLNMHDHMNHGITQEMALIIDNNGNWTIQNNEKL